MKITRTYEFCLQVTTGGVLVKDYRVPEIEAKTLSEAFEKLNEWAEPLDAFEPPLHIVSWEERTVVSRQTVNGKFRLNEVAFSGITKDDLMTAYGYQSGDYDVALPQGWLEFVAKKMAGLLGEGSNDDYLRAYDMIRKDTVWLYKGECVTGNAFFLTAEMEKLWKEMEAAEAKLQEVP